MKPFTQWLVLSQRIKNVGGSQAGLVNGQAGWSLHPPEVVRQQQPFFSWTCGSRRQDKVTSGL